jgi:TolA-binding protein
MRGRRLLVPLGVAAALALVLLQPARDPLARLADPGPAPAFIPVPVRTAQIAPGVGDRGMRAYAAGNYRRAARMLDSAAAVDPTPATQFFLGVSLLKSGNEQEAAAALRDVVSDSVNPYAAEAALWLAKAWLRAGLPDSAEAVLRSLSRRPVDPGITAHARALTDSIREVRGR